MPNCQVKTPAEHRDYVRELVRISFHFAYNWWREHPDEGMSAAVAKRTPLCHHALNVMRNEGESHPAWQDLLARAELVASTAADAAAFEETMYDYSREFADERADRFYPESVGVMLQPDWNVRSLKYDPPHEHLPAGYCNFHIANALAPKSILADPRHLPECFLEMMDRTEQEYGYHTIHTSTWLNEEPRWLALFPQEWHENLGPRSETIHWHFGYWGQLVNARGTLNRKAARHLREHGALRYLPRSSHCSFTAMRDHLAGVLSRGASPQEA
ncbi:MAG: hypothetical protein HN742_34435 [Lentisphaerae bacterium]|jgi:hypothetical protein|nr:hypothetical protein [Lentisphaerota bacterium]MBT4822398.1 hypothetical protein [Lentisphaerota bacterium]MBT5605057.1 hypothetical protein [Lentisphaerota bacterium]MBT7058679.1 hypothetical protein [Lentisphaerota bacterium]MBT7847020.1 hypothetical protein [Lentisphaerota bacterium]